MNITYNHLDEQLLKSLVSKGKNILKKTLNGSTNGTDLTSKVRDKRIETEKKIAALCNKNLQT